MSLLCTTSCGTPPKLSQGYYDCTAEQFRTAGANQFILHTCNVAWTDLLDTAEWTTKVAAGDVEASMPGILTINEPEFTEVPMLGCGDTKIFDITYLIDYETYFADDTLDDWAYWTSTFQRSSLYRIIFLDCDGVFWMEPDWAVEVKAGTPATIAGEHPGFKFDFTKPPHLVDGEGRMKKWTTQFRVRTGQRIMGQALLPGVQAVL